MTRVRYATPNDMAQIKELRRSVFADELQVQHQDYQDVFNDHYSKNLALVINGKANDIVIGAARLAYSRANASFYISYFVIKAEYRTTKNGSLLLSAMLHLLTINQIAVVKADAYDQLKLFLKLGFVVTGPKFTKYGFNCHWTPVELVLSDTPTKTRNLLQCVKTQLPEKQALWSFEHNLQCYTSVQGYRHALSHAINTGQYKNVLLHIGSNNEPVINNKLKQLTKLADITPLPSQALNDVEVTQFEQAFNDINQKLNPQHVIGIDKNAHSVKPIAQYYALMTGKKLFEYDKLSSFAYQELQSNPAVQSITLFCTSTACDHGFYQSLKNLQTDYKVGIIAGQTPEVVSWHCLKNILEHLGPSAGKDLMLLPFENKSLTADEATVLCNDEFDGQTVQNITTSDALNSLSILSHGRGDMVYQQGHIFCGKSRTLLTGKQNLLMDDKAPFCVKTGHCYKEGVLTHADTLTAKFVLLNTCFAYANIFAAQYTVGWALLKSHAAQVIASERAKDGTSIENIFAYCLYKQGFKTGDIVHYMNQVIRKTAMETQSYLLFGDPCVCTYPSQNQQSTLTIDNADESLLIDINSDKPKYLLSFSCSLTTFGAGTISELFFYHKRKTAIKVLHYCHQDTLYLFVFSLQTLPQQITLNWRNNQSIVAQIAKVHRCLNSAQHNDTFKLTIGTEKKLKKDLEAQVKHLTRLKHEGYENLNSNFKLLQNLEKYGKQIDSLYQEFTTFMLDKMSHRSWIITDDYLDQCSEIDTDMSKSCYLCGNQLFVRQIKHNIMANLCRTHINCVDCGAIGDIETHYRLPEFSGDNVLKVNEHIEQAITLYNPFDYQINGTIGLRVYQTPVEDTEITPPLAEISIPAQSQKTVDFTIKVNENVPKHLVFVKSIACFDGAILYSQKNFWVTANSNNNPKLLIAQQSIQQPSENSK